MKNIDTSKYIRSIVELRKICKSENIKSIKDYRKLCERNDILPTMLDQLYKEFTNIRKELGLVEEEDKKRR